MHNKMRFVVVLLIAALLVPAFGVVRAQDTGEVVFAPQQCAAPGELTMWVWDENWQKVLTESVAAWESIYCNGATVNIELYPWANYWDTLQTNAAAGDLPDIFNISQDRFFFYAENEALLNLQPYLDAAEIDETLFPSGGIDPYRIGEAGDAHAVPLEWVTVAVLYNKDMFDAAGLEYPTNDWTWDDFAEAAAALTKPEEDIYGAAVYSEFQGGFANWIAATGTSPIVNAEKTECTVDDPGSVEALTFLKNLYDQGYMPSVSTLGGTSADDAFNFFVSGKVAMITAGAWKLPQAFESIEFNWDVVKLPKNPTTERSRSIVHSVGYAAAANSDNPDLAANLIIYLISDEGQRFFAEAGGVAPANPSEALLETWLSAFPEGVNVRAYADAREDSQGVTVTGNIGAVNNEIVVNLFDLNMSVEDTVAAACETVLANLPE
jgi:multiple sugar transport system substrate-binding protein